MLGLRAWRRSPSSIPDERPVAVEEYYGETPPAVDAKRVVTRLLNGTSPRVVRGLQRVVLLNAANLNRQRRREKTRARGKDVSIPTARGLYFARREKSDAYIELFVDNILGTPGGVKRTPLHVLIIALRNLLGLRWFRAELCIAEVLFHEIGHHIHATQAPEHRERENVADDWGEKLFRRYFYWRYWYVFPVVWPIVAVYAYIWRITRQYKTRKS